MNKKIEEQKTIRPINKYVGQRLRERRWVLGLTQQKLAEAVGIKFQQIQKYETGMNQVSAARMWDLSKALDVPISYFFEGFKTKSEEPTPVAQPAEIPVLDKETATLIHFYRQIPERQRRKLFDLAQTLSDLPEVQHY